METTPAKTTTRVTSWGGAARMSPRMTAVRSPDFSATPTPRSATRTVPRGTKPAKLGTMFWNIHRMPSGARRELVVIMAPSAPGRGSSTLTPSEVVMAEMMTMPSAKRAKRVTGWGRRLPSHSTKVRKRVMKLDLGLGSEAGSGMERGYRIVDGEATGTCDSVGRTERRGRKCHAAAQRSRGKVGSLRSQGVRESSSRRAVIFSCAHGLICLARSSITCMTSLMAYLMSAFETVGSGSFQ